MPLGAIFMIWKKNFKSAQLSVFFESGWGWQLCTIISRYSYEIRKGFEIKCSAPIGARKCIFPKRKLWQTDHPTYRPTERRTWVTLHVKYLRRLFFIIKVEIKYIIMLLIYINHNITLILLLSQCSSVYIIH